MNLPACPTVVSYTHLDVYKRQEDMCRRVLSGFDVEVLDQFNAAYRCDCSRERVELSLIHI